MFEEWRRRNDPDCLRMLMFRFWNTLLFLSATAVLISVSFVVWTLFVPTGIEPARGGEATPETIETISREQLRGVLAAFEQRDLQFRKLSNEPPTIADPSK